jgi:hypothetical protein
MIAFRKINSKTLSLISSIRLFNKDLNIQFTKDESNNLIPYKFINYNSLDSKIENLNHNHSLIFGSLAILYYFNRNLSLNHIDSI